MSKSEVFLWVTVNMNRRNTLLATNVASCRICNTMSMSVSFYCIMFSFLISHKLVLITNKALYLLKEALVDTSQKKSFYCEGGRFNNFQTLNTSAKFCSSFDFSR